MEGIVRIVEMIMCELSSKRLSTKRLHRDKKKVNKKLEKSTTDFVRIYALK